MHSGNFRNMSIFHFFTFFFTGAKEFLQKRAVANFAAADATYGRMIQSKLQILAQKNKRKSSGPSAPSAAALNPPRNIPRGGSSHL